MKGLNDDEVLDLDAERKEWIKECHPIDVQRKAADKMGLLTLRKSAASQYKEMGMRSVVWEFHENRAGTKLFQLLSWQKLWQNFI
jgi:hypothetical protein